LPISLERTLKNFW